MVIDSSKLAFSDRLLLRLLFIAIVVSLAFSIKRVLKFLFPVSNLTPWLIGLVLLVVGTPLLYRFMRRHFSRPVLWISVLVLSFLGVVVALV
jgi:predicted Na+-dependent transporter